MLRIYQAHFSEEIKNTEARRKLHHSYKEKFVAHAGYEMQWLNKNQPVFSEGI